MYLQPRIHLHACSSWSARRVLPEDGQRHILLYVHVARARMVSRLSAHLVVGPGNGPPNASSDASAARKHSRPRPWGSESPHEALLTCADTQMRPDADVGRLRAPFVVLAGPRCPARTTEGGRGHRQRPELLTEQPITSGRPAAPRLCPGHAWAVGELPPWSSAV